MSFVSKMHGFDVKSCAHHYTSTSCLVHARCAAIRMNTVSVAVVYFCCNNTLASYLPQWSMGYQQSYPSLPTQRGLPFFLATYILYVSFAYQRTDKPLCLKISMFHPRFDPTVGEIGGWNTDISYIDNASIPGGFTPLDLSSTSHLISNQEGGSCHPPPRILRLLACTGPV